MKLVVAIPTNDRPRLLERALASFHACVGAADWSAVITPETTPKRGCRANTHLACERTLKTGAEWILYLEDDVLLSRDALTLCDQFAAATLPGLLCLRRWHATQDASQPALVTPACHGLLGNGFFFPATLWPFLSSWWFRDEPGMGGRMWDWSVSWGLDTNGIPQWRPMVNRSRNVGVHGTHATNGADLNHFGPCYEGEPISHFTFTP